MNPAIALDGKIDVLYNDGKTGVDAFYIDLTGTKTSVNLSDMLKELDGKRVKIAIEIMEES